MNNLLTVKNLKVKLKKEREILELVENINFTLESGKCLGILGESGSGKSMTCKAIMGILDETNFKIEGEIISSHGILKRGKDMVGVLQNPMSCFDPLYTLESQMAETFTEHLAISPPEIKKLSLEVLKSVHLKDAEDVLKKYPHQLSGGMLQRIMIGMALAMKPKLIIADEPTTAIDAVTQYEIMKIFKKAKKERNIGMIFISHDLGVISAIADEIIVMDRGKVISQGTKEKIFSHGHGYTNHIIEKKMAVMKRYKEILKGRIEQNDNRS